MNISELEAKKLVEKYLLTQDLRGYKYEFVKVNSNKNKPNEFGVVFNVFTSNNSPVDGPVVFLVDKINGDVRAL